MNKKNQKTLESIFRHPTPSNIPWKDIESLFKAIGCKISEGYIGDVNFDSEAHLFHGEVINTRDVITFQGKSVDELEKAFIDSVEDYVEWCKEDGVSPEKPYSGKFNLRLSPELHKEVAITAKKMKISINKFVEKAVVDELTLQH